MRKLEEVYIYPVHVEVFKTQVLVCSFNKGIETIPNRFL